MFPFLLKITQNVFPLQNELYPKTSGAVRDPQRVAYDTGSGVLPPSLHYIRVLGPW